MAGTKAPNASNLVTDILDETLLHIRNDLVSNCIIATKFVNVVLNA